MEELLIMRHLAGRETGVAGGGDRQPAGRLSSATATGGLGVLVAEPGDTQRGGGGQVTAGGRG